MSLGILLNVIKCKCIQQSQQYMVRAQYIK